MSNKPKIYANCKAGCLWETVHKDDWQSSAGFIRQDVTDNGTYKEYILEAGQTVILKGDIIGETGLSWKVQLQVIDAYGNVYHEETVARSLWDNYLKVTSCRVYHDADRDVLRFYFEVGRRGAQRTCEVSSAPIYIRLMYVDEVYLVNDAMEAVLLAEEVSV